MTKASDGSHGAGEIEEAQHLGRIGHAREAEAEAEQEADEKAASTRVMARLPQSTWRTTNTVAKPAAMNVRVATSERGDRRARPQTPWPLVQPLARRVPKPTRRPPAISVAGPADNRRRRRLKQEARDEGREDRGRGSPPPASPVAGARRNEAAEQAGGAEDAAVPENEPCRREADQHAAGQAPRAA